jgi:hypothetical protein
MAKAKKSTTKSATKAPAKAAAKKTPANKAPAKAAAKSTAAKSTAAKSTARPTAAKSTAAKSTAASSADVGVLIDMQIDDLGDWRGEMLGKLRALIKEADPDVIEELKWGGVPTWSDAGIITTGETYKKVVKLTFAKGASLPDPHKLFNSSLGGNTRRAIDFPEGSTVNEAALKQLVREAVALNRSSQR